MRSLALAVLLVAVGCGGADSGGTQPAAEESAPPLPFAETGFVDVPAQPPPGVSVPGRMFYSFHAAEAEPANKPLFVVYNGGPGAATTSGLVLAGAGPYRVDLSAPIGAMPMKSARSLVELGNVLFIDQRGAGFSYDLGEKGFCFFDPMKDAAEFLRVIVEVVERHPALSRSKLVLVGESYGGLRTIAILSLLLEYADSRARELGVTELVERWATRSLGSPGETPFPQEKIAERILGLVLIQPLLLAEQLRHTTCTPTYEPDPANRPPDADEYDLRRSRATVENEIEPRLAAALGNREAAKLVFGVDLDTTRGLVPQDRAGAKRSLDPLLGRELPGLNEALSSRLGKLGDHDAYHYARTSTCGGENLDAEIVWNRFLLAARHTPLFITNARYDGVIHSPCIVQALRARGTSPALDTEPRPGVVRPGWFSFDVPTEGSPHRVEVRFPSYEAGHQVPETQGPEFVEDVATWLAR